MAFNLPVSPHATASMLNRPHPLLLSGKSHLDSLNIAPQLGSFSSPSTATTSTGLSFPPYLSCAHSDSNSSALVSRLSSPGLLYPKANGRGYTPSVPAPVPPFVTSSSSSNLNSMPGACWDKTSPMFSASSLCTNGTAPYGQSNTSPSDMHVSRTLRTLTELSASQDNRHSDGSVKLTSPNGQSTSRFRSTISVPSSVSETLDPGSHGQSQFGDKLLDSSKSAFRPHTRTPSPVSQSRDTKPFAASPNVAMAAMAAALAATGLRFPPHPGLSSSALPIPSLPGNNGTVPTTTGGNHIPEFSALMAAAVAAAASAINSPTCTLSAHRNTPHTDSCCVPGAPTSSTISSSSTSSLVSIISQPMDELTHLSDFKQASASYMPTVPMQPESPDPMDADNRPKVELVDKYLWDKFHAQGTEMVITKSGR
ncbi:unnamed protein product [Echinostoma caproni]|uniref:T-box domain-containing protein n=1 Tax=Echinostoma caproni TaxID=27848 RepID=A0A183B4S1_9TREM|nr:unnamed protein product [Echinostoma caproni]